MNADTERSISLVRTSAGKYVATNPRGGELAFGAVERATLVDTRVDEDAQSPERR